VLSGLRGEHSIAELCRREGIEHHSSIIADVIIICRFRRAELCVGVIYCAWNCMPHEWR
jgi:hypothetical protein